MKDFERLVRVREIWEKQSRVQLGQANRELSEAESEVEDAAARHKEQVSQTAEPGGPSLLELWRLAALSTEERFANAQRIRSQASDRSRAAQGAWRRAAQQADIARSLEERRKQAMAYAARRASEATLDELMAMRKRKGPQ